MRFDNYAGPDMTGPLAGPEIHPAPRARTKPSGFDHKALQAGNDR
jgi:hypothetical protein